ncbi:TELO2-interacting protein 2-like [Procambarus clarkii]|uniref:TELO2-interacting protein 2-like n=1 Tax=Procambarus clarkii TaxID=6728 RepID=UPI003741F895
MTLIHNDKLLNLLERLNISGSQVCEDELTSIITYVIEACRVPPLQNVDLPYTELDFEGVANNAEIQLNVVIQIIQKIYSVKKQGYHFSHLFIRNAVVNCFLVACEFSDENWEWVNKKAASASKNVMNKLCEVCQCKSVRELLNGEFTDTSERSYQNSGTSLENEKEISYIKFILQAFSGIFNKNNWKTYPSLKMSYWKILQYLNQKTLGEQLAYLLPPALFIVDDWEQRNKVLGLNCLLYIIRNTTGSELRWYGRGAVIYDALKPILYSREAKVLEILYPAITEVAYILESDPSNAGKLKSESAHDIILHQLLREMRHEQKLALRSVYAVSLPSILSSMGIFAIRWSQTLMDVCSDYLATCEGLAASDRISILRALQVYVQKCWPQVHTDASSMVQMVVRLLYDVTAEDSDYSPQIVCDITKEAELLINLLNSAAPKTMQELCRGLQDISVHAQCQLILKRIFNISSNK